MDERIDYLANKCKVALEKGDYDSLLLNAQDLEKIVTDKYLARFWQGMAYYYKKDFTKSGAIFYNLYSSNFSSKEEDDALLFYLAMNYLYLHKLKESILIFKKLEEKDPKNVDVKVMLYIALHTLGDDAAALAELAEALKIDKNKAILDIEQIIEVALQKNELKEETKHVIRELVKRLG